MSNFTEALSTVQTISMAAMEEASRVGLRTADLEHMLLALTISEQDAGRVLRVLGVTLEATRGAIAAQHAEQLASLGVETEPIDGGEIVLDKTGGYTWTERATTILGTATKGGKVGNAQSLLRALLQEPSGLIVEILSRLDVAPEHIIARLDEYERAGAAHHPECDADPLSRTTDTFVPAAPEEVWALLVEPSRLPEWYINVGEIDAAAGEGHAGESWTARARTVAPDGKKISVKASSLTLRIELAERVDEHLIEWRFHFPDAPRSNSKRVRFALEPAVGGTQVRLTVAWQRGRLVKRPRVLTWMMRPVWRLVLWIDATAIAGAVARAFR